MHKRKMMKSLMVGLFILMTTILFGWNRGLSTSDSDHHTGHTTQAASSAESQIKRRPLDLPLSAQEGLKLTMREHLEAINAIVAALAQDNFLKAATLVHEELGFPKHHQAMQREEGASFPPAYHELAMVHHKAAEALGEVIPTKNLKRILSHLEMTIHACVKCHQAFRL